MKDSLESYAENPFTPSFGEIPPHLAGRTQVIEGVIRAFRSSSRRPELTTLFSGARGTGKTTLLSLLANKAEENGWISVSVTALPGMMEDIEVQARRRAAHLLRQGNRTISGVTVANVGGITLSPQREEPSNWRSRMSDVLDDLESAQTGLVITVDEVDATLGEMVELAAIYQHFIREGRRVCLLMAGLPHNISALLNNKTVSFLRRSQVVPLRRIADSEVKSALSKTILEHGRDFDGAGLDQAVTAIQGFPFLIQLVGFRSWDANINNKTITLGDFELGVNLAHEEMTDRILRATYQELSDGDLEFIQAMLEDEEESRIADITSRLGKSSSSVAQFRRRLIDAGIIGIRRRGVIGFDMPYFRDFILEELGLSDD